MRSDITAKDKIRQNYKDNSVGLVLVSRRWILIIIINQRALTNHNTSANKKKNLVTSIPGNGMHTHKNYLLFFGASENLPQS
jgi:hypothetical protein